MFDDFPIFVLAAVPMRKMVWGWVSTLVICAIQGLVQAGFFKFAEELYDSCRDGKDKKKKYGIGKNIDKSNRTLGPVDWISLESPFESPFSLNLRGTNVTDQDLIDHLVGQKMLRRLDVCYCRDITYRGVRKFKKLRPDCKVIHNWYKFWNYFFNVALFISVLINLLFLFL